MEIYELSDKEFRIILLRKLSEVQENTNRQLNKIRKLMHEQNKKFHQKKPQQPSNNKNKNETTKQKSQSCKIQ